MERRWRIEMERRLFSEHEKEVSWSGGMNLETENDGDELQNFKDLIEEGQKMDKILKV